MRTGRTGGALTAIIANLRNAGKPGAASGPPPVDERGRVPELPVEGVRQHRMRPRRVVVARISHPIAYLDRMGFLGPDVIAAHVVWLGDGDLEILKQRGTSVAHCATSNLKPGSGVAPVRQLRNAGVAVGIGTDGPASNNSLDILADLKIAALLQKGVNHVPREMPAADIVAMATVDGAAVLGLGDELGRLAPGYLADVIPVDATGAHLTPFHPGGSAQAYAHLVYSAKATDVRTVIIDGRIRMLDGTIVGLDERAVLDGAQRASSRILVAAGLLPGAGIG